MGGNDTDATRKVPPYLYRYFLLPEKNDRDKLERIRRIIVEKKLYSPSPSEFNDPFDCKTNILTSPEPGDELDNFIDVIINIFYSDRIKSGTEDEIQRIKDPKMHLEKLENIKTKLQDELDEHGLLCLAERNDNLLMWSHYAGGHSGICLEFNTENIFFGGLGKVSYEKHLPKVDMTPLLLSLHSADGDNKEELVNDAANKIFLTKATCWEYEKEWRLPIENGSNQEHEYPLNALEAIFLGLQISPSNKQFILKCVASLPNPPKVYQAKKKKREYALEFEPVIFDTA